ncbi:hypothetical protein GCM10009670_16070 [Citricoccus alkalitolerans]
MPEFRFRSRKAPFDGVDPLARTYGGLRIRTCDPLEDPVSFRSPPIVSGTRGFPG